ncbi:type II toxin-antitoxin system RelE/ParE family toxin [Roseimarinus sediminis]|jgi:plasmid stabilization system protein ParE|uniref:type II toxin-antitoxin system RelE/ParE family toxin n=1 Tax=Roseimarinus sediminis TaxID=1610899 RepID=UPI003D26171D
MYKLIVTSYAESDAVEAANWYNNKKAGLGSEFLLALDKKIISIKQSPQQFQIIYKNIRRALTERFPYGIFFILREKTIYILAILHTSRNPKT